MFCYVAQNAAMKNCFRFWKQRPAGPGILLFHVKKINSASKIDVTELNERTMRRYGVKAQATCGGSNVPDVFQRNCLEGYLQYKKIVNR